MIHPGQLPNVAGLAGPDIPGAQASVISSVEKGVDMQTFWKLAPWLTRVIPLLPIVLFARIALPHVFHPVETLAVRGISFSSGFGITTARIGFGAFPLGFSLFLVGCLLSERRLLIGLSLVATLDAVILVVRIFGMMADASVRENMRLVDAEVILLIVMNLGIILELSRRAGNRKPQEAAQGEVGPARLSNLYARIHRSS
jgi:hypothetical protein